MPSFLRRTLWCLTVAAVAAGQMQPPKDNHYEVVSIKQGVSGECGYRPSPLQLHLENCPLDHLVERLLYAHRAYGGGLAGLPKWASSAWYTITAKSVRPATALQQWAMLVPVLEDRFGLKWHREKRQKPVYFLSVSKNGVRFPVTGPGSCVPFDPNADIRSWMDPTKPLDPNKLPCEVFVPSGTKDGGIHLQGRGITMAALRSFLEKYFDRPLLDSTGLMQRFDVSLEFAPNPATEGTDQPLPSLSAALKAVGLIVTRGKGLADVLVIDHIERPSEN